MLLLRHQFGAIVATLVDFVVMIGLVSGLRALPVVGTAIGASAGAGTNFWLGRRWIFRVSDVNAGPQAFRYGLVALVSLLLNSAGEHLLVAVLGMQYILARVIIAASVSLAWNFPMHRYFVFPPANKRSSN